MNERIRELSNRAWAYAESYDYTNAKDQQVEFCDILEEKFAELIVRECIETLRLVPYSSDRDFGDEEIYQEAIYKHFGVEE
jgi:hypothetical protein